MGNKVIIDDETNKIQKIELLEYLRKINKEYIPPISKHVKLSDYAKKLIEKASIVTARAGEDKDLVGVCAFYCNNYINKKAFISTIGVLSNYTGKGIAENILDKTILICSEKRMERIELDVFCENEIAINFYKKHGFYLVNTYEKVNRLEKVEFWNLMKMDL